MESTPRTGQPSQPARPAAPPPNRTLAWLVAIGIVLFGTWFGQTVVITVFAAEGPPLPFLVLPWFASLVLGWSVRRWMLGRPPRAPTAR